MPMSFFDIFLPRSPQYLSFKPSNGRPNVRSLVYQAVNAKINDPRPYVQAVLQAEQTRVAEAVRTFDYDSVKYGFNIKLASFIGHFKEIKDNCKDDLPLKVVKLWYSFEKELAAYSKIMENTTVCPYAWLFEEINRPEYHRPSVHTIYSSNKFSIFIKDGKINYDEKTIRHTVPLKFDLTSSKFYF